MVESTSSTQNVEVVPSESNVENSVNERSENNREANENSATVHSEEEKSTTTITHENNPLLHLARGGKVDGIEFSIGTPTETLIEKWGLPVKNMELG